MPTHSDIKQLADGFNEFSEYMKNKPPKWRIKSYLLWRKGLANFNFVELFKIRLQVKEDE